MSQNNDLRFLLGFTTRKQHNQRAKYEKSADYAMKQITRKLSGMHTPFHHGGPGGAKGGDKKGQAPALTNAIYNQWEPGFQPKSFDEIIHPLEPYMKNGKLIYPGPQTDAGDFGPRINPSSHRPGFHTGIDMSVPMGTPIYAAASGIVDSVKAGDPIYGNQVVLFHGQNRLKHEFDTMYGHMEKYIVREGQKVAQGQLLGYVGATGNATGPHLHFETHVNGAAEDPEKYLTKGDLDRLKSSIIYSKEHNYPDRTYKNEDIQVNPSSGKLKDKKDKKGTKEDSPAGGPAWTMAELFGLTPIPKKKHKSGSDLEPVAQKTNVVGKTDQKLQAFLSAISEQESGGDDNYGALGVPTHGSRAYGKYQIMGYNIDGPGGWDKEALGHDVSLEDFLHTPDLQEEIARKKLTEYYNQFGPAGAAKAWYAGPGNAMVSSNRSQYGGPSINSYAAQILKKMGHY